MANDSPLLTAHSSATLAAIIQSSDDAIIGKDLDGKITSWNASAERIFGFKAAEAIGQPITLIIPPDRLDEERTILGRIRRGEPVDHFETVRRAKDGSLRTISLTVSPIKDGDGRIVGASKIARDITRQRATLAELRKSEERFRVTLASIGDAVIATDAQGRVAFMNAIAEALTGWTQREAVGRSLSNVFRIVNERTRQPVESPVDKVLRQGGIVGLANHTVLIGRDGRERPIDDSGAPIRDDTYAIVGVVLVFRDVSERRRLEIATQRLAAIVDHSREGVIGKDLNGIVTSWNKGAERIFGYTAAEMVGQPVTRLMDAAHRDEEQRILARIQRGEVVEAFETERLRKDGQTIWVRATISPIKDDEGQIVGASKLASDITETRRAQAALDAAHQALARHAEELEAKVQARTAELEDKVSELEAFSYSLSHDLRAPLRSIESFAELIIMDYAPRLDETALSHLQRIVNAAKRMDRLIQDVLAFSRVSQRVIVPERVDVETLVDELVHERAELQPPRAIVTIERPLLPILGHSASLTQCLTNLLDNAVKFVAPGVTPQVRIRTARAGNFVRLWVEDNGIGIPPEGQRRLFALFQRVHTSADYRGMGIGLAIVRKAAERMQGTVGVESEPGHGSRFWLQLPKP